jgi:serine/threonine protein kinase
MIFEMFPFHVDTQTMTHQKLSPVDETSEIYMQLFDQIVNCDVRFPTSDTSSNHCPVTNEAKDLLSRMLTKDPSQRITLQEILTHPWLQMTSSEVMKREN